MSDKSPELSIDHEVRIRLLEKIATETKDTLKEFRSDLKDLRSEFRSELRSQFHWAIGMNFTIILTILIPVILHFAKLL
jgi:hypothetical protein